MYYAKDLITTLDFTEEDFSVLPLTHSLGCESLTIYSSYNSKFCEVEVTYLFC